MLQQFLVFGVDLLPLLLLVVLPPYLLDLLLGALDVVLELIALGLVHVYLSRQLLHLPRLRVQRFLQDAQLFGRLQPRLLLHDLSDLLDLFLLLVDDHLLLDDLLRLVDEPFLEGLDLLLHFVDVGVSALEVAAAVHVERVLQLLRKRLHLQLLLNQLALQGKNLPLEQRDLLGLLHEDLQLPLQVALLVVQQFEVGLPLPEGGLPPCEGGLLDLYLLVEEGGLVVAADQLRSQDVPLSQDQFVLVLLLFALALKGADVRVQLRHLIVEVLDHLPFGVHLLLLLFELPTVLQQRLVLLLMLEMLLSQRNLLRLDLFLELVDLMVDDLVPPLGLCNLVLVLAELLAVVVAGRPHVLV